MRKLFNANLSLFITSLFVSVLIGCWVLLVIHEMRALSPCGTTVAEHLSTMREPTDFRVIWSESGQHLAVHGPRPSALAFRSTHPVYIYGPDGQLVDWTWDEGDDPNFNLRWPGVFAGRQLTRDEAARWPHLGR